MRPCAWPRGCHEWASVEDLCYLHQKYKAGLLDADPRTVLRGKFGIPRASVLSDEQTELAALLRDLGASKQTVARALTRKERTGPRG